MRARNAKALDSATIAKLMNQLGYGAVSGLIEKRLADYEVDPNSAVFVVESESVVIGVISCQIINLFHVEGCCGRITSLVTDKNHRGLGVGKLLVNEAERYFKSAGCVKSEVSSGDHRSAAHTFYESCGYTQDERRFLKQYD